jgi:methionyl aminopeptidase
MRTACRLTGETLELIESMLVPGITTAEIDYAAEKFILSQGARPSFLHYRGFPKSVCISINEEVIHGIPSSRKLKEGDIASVDIGVFFDGFHGDAARTLPVGKISADATKLIEVTKQSFFEGIKFARAGNHVHDISKAVQDFVESNGFSVVREYVGHGVGKDLHEDPSVPNYRPPNRGARLQAGMTIAVEPMVNIGGAAIKVLADKWTVITKDGSLSAHYENTIAITDGEPEILTLINRG